MKTKLSTAVCAFMLASSIAPLVRADDSVVKSQRTPPATEEQSPPSQEKAKPAEQNAGLRCNGPTSMLWYDGSPLPVNIDCRFIPGPQGPYVPGPRYKLLSDGRWQVVDEGNRPITPLVYLAPGSLQRFSTLAVAGGASKVFVHSPVLDDLLKGGRIEWVNEGAKNLAGKRVAVITTSKMTDELNRFKRERQGLIDESAHLQDQEIQKFRKEFIDASNPDALLLMIVKTLRWTAKEVTAVDDLASFKKGGYDYAVIVHWKFDGRFDSINDLGQLPLGASPARQGSSYYSVSGILINAEMQAVHLYGGRPVGLSVGLPAKEVARKSRNELVEEYFRTLAFNYGQDWGGKAPMGGYIALVFH